MAPIDPAVILSSLRSVQDWMLVVRHDGTIAWASEPCAVALGMLASELEGRPLASLHASLRWIDELPRHVEEAERTATPIRFMGLGGGPAGPRVFEYVLSTVADVAGHNPPAFVIIGRDITEHRQELALLREHEEFFRLIFQRGAMGIVILSPDARVLRVNQSFCEIVGRSEEDICGRSVGDYTHPDDSRVERVLLQELQRGEREWYEFEKRLIRPDGRDVWIRMRRNVVRDREGHPRYLVGMAEDIDDRKRGEADRIALEQRLQDRQKLESLGVLAGGIAHDLNNLLVPILGNAEMIMDELPKFGPQHHAMQEIVRASQRAADLAQQMLAFSGRGHAVLEPLDLSALLDQMRPVLRASISRGVALAITLAKDLPLTRADPMQVRQVVLNLLQNASEACTGPGGSVRVTTGVERLDREHLDALIVPGESREGDYSFLRITDTGSGADADTRAHLFEPFFTTKGPGRGLGLPAVLGVVRGHHGVIGVDTVPGAGTTVTVYFPVIAPDQPHAASEGSEVAAVAAPKAVLIVEDDEAVRGLAMRTLQRAGYRVFTADDGVAAVETIEAEPTIDCVILDVLMPRLDGVRTCQRLKEVAPDVPIVVMSGHLDPGLTTLVAPYTTVVLQKPFSPRALRDAVQTAIASKTAG